MERFCATMSGSECAKPRSNLVPVDNLVSTSKHFFEARNLRIFQLQSKFL